MTRATRDEKCVLTEDDNRYFCMLLERIMDATCVCRNNGCVCVRIAHIRAKSFSPHSHSLCMYSATIHKKNDAALLCTQSVSEGQRTVGIHSSFRRKKNSRSDKLLPLLREGIDIDAKSNFSFRALYALTLILYCLPDGIRIICLFVLCSRSHCSAYLCVSGSFH